MIRYTVREDKALDPESVTSSTLDPSKWVTVPVWLVTRVSDGQGWHIGKYRTKEAADGVAALLTALTLEEID